MVFFLFIGCIFFSQVTFPLWLNADILSGPVDSTTKPVDAQQFLKLSADHQRAVLSIGWTTKYGGNITKGEYTKDHTDAMLRVLKDLNVAQTVTFPVSHFNSAIVFLFLYIAPLEL